MKNKCEKDDLKDYQGDVYLGIDVGSTTSKVVLIDPDGKILYSYYDSNLGNPLELMIEIMKKIYSILQSDVQKKS